MKSVATTLLAALMIAGTVAAVTTPKPTTNTQVAALPGDSGPLPACYPTDPTCPPLVPPAVR